MDVHSQLPLVVPVTLRPEGAVVVVEENLRLVEDHPSTHLDIDKSTIERTPTAVQSRAMESILLATPGFVADENGRFHFRGSHGQMTYVVDGIPVSDQLHATFSNSLDPSQVESMEVITGGISAEYGGKPVVVVNVGVDRYTFGKVERISPEAPVPILQVTEQRLKLGMAKLTDLG